MMNILEKYLTIINPEEAYTDADIVVDAASTNYDSKKNFFDIPAIEEVIKHVSQYNSEAIMVIKSTIPVRYTTSVREKLYCNNIILSSEFLRGFKFLYDNLYPSRIIVETDVENVRLEKTVETFSRLFQEDAIKEDIDALFMCIQRQRLYSFCKYVSNSSSFSF